MRRLLAFCLAVASVLTPLCARADVQACLGASEKGQRARAAGRLREARDLFLVCGAEGCPAMVRRDCTQWQIEVVSMLPSVVFGAKDRAGRDLFDVTVTMDNEVLTRKLDGKSITVDPGPHTFKLEVAGQPPVIERALVKEGEKTRVIAVTIGAPSPEPARAATAPSGASTAAQTDQSGGHTVFPWIVVGIGGAAVATGLVVLLTSPSVPEGCNETSKTCAKLPGESAADLAERQKTAGRADTQPTQGLIVGGIGLGLVAGGLLWHFLEPTGDRRTGAVRFTPWASPSSTGAALGGSF